MQLTFTLKEKKILVNVNPRNTHPLVGQWKPATASAAAFGAEVSAGGRCSDGGADSAA